MQFRCRRWACTATNCAATSNNVSPTTTSTATHPVDQCPCKTPRARQLSRVAATERSVHLAQIHDRATGRCSKYITPVPHAKCENFRPARRLAIEVTIQIVCPDYLATRSSLSWVLSRSFRHFGTLLSSSWNSSPGATLHRAGRPRLGRGHDYRVGSGRLSSWLRRS
jgi:hypothetical protein